MGSNIRHDADHAMFLENVSGFAARILRNFDLKDGEWHNMEIIQASDSAL